MRSFNFTAKNIGRERYLTYIMGEGMDVDEDVLDFCEYNALPEVVSIIYEEDDDYDYLTYDITGMTSLEKYSGEVIKKESVFKILRNISLGMISIKENALPLSYILLNKGFMYIDPDTLDIKFLYLPVEGEASVSTEFKSFVRQFIAGLRYDVEEDLAYVGQLLTYINGDGFNLRGLIGLTEALMKDAGISYDGGTDIATEDGAEVVDSVDPSVLAEDKKTDIMSGLDEADDKLPEIGDDEEDMVELDDLVAAEEPEVDPEELKRLALERAVAEKMIAEKEARLEAERLAAEKEREERETAEKAEAERIAAEKEAAEKAEAERIAAEKEAAEKAEAERIAAEKEAAEKAEAERLAAEKEREEREAAEKAEAERLAAEKAAEDEAIAKEVAKKAAREASEEQEEEEEKIHEDGTGITITKPVRVSRAAMLKAAAENLEEEEAAEKEAIEKAAEEAEKLEEQEEKPKRKKKEITEDMADVKKDSGLAEAPKKAKEEVVDNTILGNAGAIKINPYLIRVNTDERIMINKPVFKIGKASRGVDYHVSGNGAVSRQHAIILHKGDSYYIKDNKSTNHTYVDGKEIEGEEEVLLKNGSTISLGDEDFTFKVG